jgi:hypothetical protein
MHEQTEKKLESTKRELVATRAVERAAWEATEVCQPSTPKTK